MGAQQPRGVRGHEHTTEADRHPAGRSVVQADLAQLRNGDTFGYSRTTGGSAVSGVACPSDGEDCGVHERLGKVRRSWVLSYDNSPLVRSLYEGFECRSIDRANGIGNTGGKTGRRYREVLITPPPGL